MQTTIAEGPHSCYPANNILGIQFLIFRRRFREFKLRVDFIINLDEDEFI